jgi:OFA family oxalate/formate antiporter-like MFS transporter
VAAWTASSYGWGAVFSAATTCNVVAGLMALFVLKPLRARHLASNRSRLAAPPQHAAARTTVR